MGKSNRVLLVGRSRRRGAVSRDSTSADGPPAGDTAPPLSGPDRFGLLASALAGRTLRVAAGEIGERARTDRAAINVDPAGAAPDQVVALTVQASMLAAGSLDSEIVRRLRGKSELTHRDLAVAVHRALVANLDVLPPRVLRIVDHELAARVDSATDSLVLALGDEPLDEPPTTFGTVHPKRLLAADRADADATAAGAASGDSAGNGHGTPQDDEELGDEYGRLPSFLTDIVGGRGLLARLLQRTMGLGRESEGGVTGGGVPRSARTLIAPGRGTTTVGRVEATGEAAAARYEGVVYPEWDVHRRGYRSGWCTVAETEPRPAQSRSLPMPAVRRLNRPLARLSASPDRLRRRMQGDDLDVDAVVEEQVELATGSSPAEAVYIESLRRKPDLAVLVLLDISGSAELPSPAGGTVHEQQRDAAARLTSALHGLGNRVALHGFCSHGRSSVRVLRVKRFEDELDAGAMRRLAGLVPGAYTRLGAVIRHGAATVEEQGGTTRRLLVVVSDGLAYDHGYEGAYAVADARRALAEARRSGIGCVCLSVGADADPGALRRVFGTAAHAAVGSPEDLPRIVGPLFRDALRSAQFRQRTTHRNSVRRQRPSEISRRSQ